MKPSSVEHRHFKPLEYAKLDTLMCRVMRGSSQQMGGASVTIMTFDSLIAVGASICSERDRFSRRRGRHLSSLRAAYVANIYKDDSGIYILMPNAQHSVHGREMVGNVLGWLQFERFWRRDVAVIYDRVKRHA